MLTQRRAAVLGSPIAHSLSPVLHRAAYRELGLDWRYDSIDLTADALPGFLADLGPEWVGLSLTMPLKESVLGLLDQVSALAERTAAVNTVLLSGGIRRGDNTDVYGLVAALRAGGCPSPRSATIVGGGATARSAAAALRELGAQDLAVVARRPAAAQAVLAVFGGGSGVAWDEAGTALGADIVVSTVPGDAAAGLVGLLPARPGCLLDVTYRPWPTTLAAAWGAAGGVIVPGWEMLLHQAARQVELMTGQAAPESAMRAALNLHL